MTENNAAGAPNREDKIMTKNIDKLEADARRANAALRAARRDIARREHEALVSAQTALGARLACLAGADTAETVEALSARLSDDALRMVVVPPAQVETPRWGVEG